MTENKRFTNIAKEPIFIVIQDNFKDEVLADDEVVELLNVLHEEKQKMKEIIENLVNRDAVWEKKARQQVHELKEENKELKLQLNHLEYRFTEYRIKVNKND